MALRQYTSLSHDDEDKFDLAKGMGDSYEPPDYPGGCCFSISRADLTKAGAEQGDPGQSMHFAAMGEVTSINKSIGDCRIELQIGEFAGDDGKFFDLEHPSYISLCQRELDKMGLEADCERGDLLHMVGTARLESSSSSEYGDMCTLQITDVSVEDESTESREG